MRTQWIASWKERGVQGVSADKRLVLVMEDYDYAFRIEELVENKYEERGKIVIPHQSSDIMKLLQGFFHKAQTLKSKVFTAVDKAPAPVLFDITMPIFKNGSVEALRFTSVNKDDGSGKIKRETVLAIYRYPSYDSFKEYNNKKVESGQLRSIPKDYIVAGIKLSNMPITNGSFVYNDCAVLDSIAHALGDEANAQKQAGGYSSSDNVDTSRQSSHNSSSDMSAPVTGSEPAPTLSEPDDEYPF